VLGRPNVGKSTLLNALVGSKISIVSPKPQTTREAIQGILSREDGQIVFVDSPGIHPPRQELGRRLVREIDRAASGCHLILLVIDASQTLGPGLKCLLLLLQGGVFRFLACDLRLLGRGSLGSRDSLVGGAACEGREEEHHQTRSRDSSHRLPPLG